ncbi:MAG: hypothetical protein U0575_02780 [Phycisphaerales bacterium]
MLTPRVITAALAAAFACTAANAQFVLTEILGNPPGNDDGQESIELQGPANASLAGFWFITIDGDGSNAGTVDERIDLGAITTGSNGLVLLRDGTGVIAPRPAAATTVVVLSFNPNIENGSNTFVLGFGTAPAINFDFDTNNDGIIDNLPPNFTVVDAVGVVENDGPNNFAYATQLGFPADFGPFGFTPDAVYRVFACDGTILGWVGGDVLGTNPGGPYTWDPAQNFGFGSGFIPALAPGQGLDLGSPNLLPGLDVNGNGVPDSCEPACPFDLNADGVVDGADLGILLGAWGGAQVGDLDGNGVVDGADLGLLLGAWGPCAA